jgi:hypothetical protein
MWHTSVTCRACTLSKAKSAHGFGSDWSHSIIRSSSSEEGKKESCSLCGANVRQGYDRRRSISMNELPKRST